MKRLFSAFFLLLVPLFVSAQCVEKPYPFRAVEQLNFSIAYECGFIWTKAGSASFSLEKEKYAGSDCYKITGFVCSAKKFDWLFPVRDTMRSFVRETDFQPLFYQSHAVEGGKADKTSLYQYFPDEGKVKLFHSKNGQTLSNLMISMPSCSFDMLSSTYALRTLDFGSLMINDTIYQNGIYHGKEIKLPIVFLGGETIETYNEKETACYKLSLVLDESDLFKKGKNLIVWISNDKGKQPVLIQAEIVVGRIKIYNVAY
jgi:Protein of unknown function (DUF3108).